MSKLWALTKLQVKNYFLRYMQNMGSSKKRTLLVVSLIWLLLVFGFMAFNLADTIYKVALQLNTPELTVTLMYIIISLMVLLFSVSALINIFYFSTSNEFLLGLPIKENQIILSKLSVQYIFSLLLSSVFIVPSLFVYFTRTGITIIGLVGGLVSVFLLPVVPLLISSILVVLLMNTAGKFINRRTMTVIVGFLAVAVMLAFQILIQRTMYSSDLIENLFANKDGLINVIGLQFPPVVWATKMIRGSLLHLLLFTGLNLVLIFIFNALAQPLVKTTLRSFNQAESRVIVKKASYDNRGKLGTLVRRNIQIVIKTPSFLMNLVMTVLLPFLIIGINSLSGSASLSQLNSMLSNFSNESLSHYLPIIVAIALISPVFFGAFSASAITREGKYFWQTKILPISAQEDLSARMLSCAILSVVGSVVMLGVVIWLMPLRIMDIVLGLIIATPAIYGILAIDLCIDINRPILNWTNPNQAIKNNMNILMALGWKVLLGIIVFILIRVFNSAIGSWAMPYGVLAVMVILALLGKVLLNSATKKYQDIEV